MATFDELIARIGQRFPGAILDLLSNEPPNPRSLVIAPAMARELALFLRDDPELLFDFCSNVTGVDWLDARVKETVKVKKLVEGLEKEVDEVVERNRPGYLEAVYHLYSMKLKSGPIVLRLRTANRSTDVKIPSLTPVWRGAEFQEREIFDLFGIVFEGHPDLRRLLMWDDFKDHPMRRDYLEPDDYEYEPTPHDDVLAKSKPHYPGSGV